MSFFLKTTFLTLICILFCNPLFTNSLVPIQDPNGMLWGLKDFKTNKIVVNFKYEKINPFKNGYALVFNNGKIGYIDSTGNEIIEPLYAQIIAEMNCGYCAFENEYGLITVFDNTGKTITPLHYGVSFLPCYQRVTMGKGVLNFKGDTILPFIFTDLHLLPEQMCIASKVDSSGFNRLYGLYNMEGVPILPHHFSFIDHFYCGRAIVCKNGKYGVIDQNGKELFYTDYNRIDRYFNDHAIVYRRNESMEIQVGIIDKNGKEVIPVKYQWLDYVYNFSEGLAAMALNRSYGFLDTNGIIVVPFKYDRVESFRNGIAKVWNGWKYVGYIDQKGNEIIKPDFEAFDQSNLRRYHEKYIIGLKDTLQYVYDFKGKEIKKLPYENIYEFDENQKSFLVIKNFKWGVLDSTFQIKIDLNYQGIEKIFPNTLLAQKNDYFGIINNQGKILLEFNYGWIRPINQEYFSQYENGVALVSKEGKVGAINTHFKEIIPIIYDEIEYYSHGLCVVKRNNKYGFVNDQGVEVIQAVYDAASAFDGYKAEVILDGEIIYIDKNGAPLKEEEESGLKH